MSDDKIRRGEDHPSCKVGWKKAEEIRYIYENTERTQEEIADMFGITQPQVSYIVNNKIWVKK